MNGENEEIKWKTLEEPQPSSKVWECVREKKSIPLKVTFQGSPVVAGEIFEFIRNPRNHEKQTSENLKKSDKEEARPTVNKTILVYILISKLINTLIYSSVCFIIPLLMHQIF